jgi:hypothetical protein
MGTVKADDGRQRQVANFGHVVVDRALADSERGADGPGGHPGRAHLGDDLPALLPLQADHVGLGTARPPSRGGRKRANLGVADIEVPPTLPAGDHGPVGRVARGHESHALPRSRFRARGT